MHTSVVRAGAHLLEGAAQHDRLGWGELAWRGRMPRCRGRCALAAPVGLGLRGAQVVHGVLRYPNTVRPIPGLDDELVAQEKEKIAALGRVLRRRASAQYQPPGLPALQRQQQQQQQQQQQS